MNNERAKIDKRRKENILSMDIVELKFWMYKCTTIDKNK